ncbi:LysR family transcriptional regulator [Alteromonas confluentis]|uniref:LysR family transcriptional regulator n=1 Tax=Alteromonas confluentis TaxID=1656094 RepID=A0A1E7ZBZ8_9ALTE|nr:LysR family transcriptional regulator [Alteromonas confluentis]OFC70992.1 LysR family transcriptional regulator [Alteromonas confluentis]
MQNINNIGSITAFVTTAKSGSFTAAGELLGLTKSAVGKSVARLEEHLGITLFHRTTRRLSLTPEGERYFESCQNALDILQHAEQELTSRIARPSGRLRVDLPAAFGRKRLLPVLLEIARRYPELTLTLSFSERFVDLIDEGIDLVVRIGELDDSSTLVARKLTTQKLVVVASKSYLNYHGIPETPDELSHHRTVVGFRRNQPVSWLLKNTAGVLSRITPPATHEFADGDAMLTAVLNDAGLSQLPLWLVGEHIASGELVTVLDNYAGGEMPINALWPKSRQLLPKIRYVVDELVARAAAGEFD